MSSARALTSGAISNPPVELVHSAIAIQATNVRFLEAFREVWTHLEALEQPTCLWAWREVREWVAKHSAAAGAETGGEPQIFCSDGNWSVMLDFSHEIAFAEEQLCFLSEVFPRVLAVVVRGEEDVCELRSYVNGYLHRELRRDGQRMSARGEALPEEAGLDLRKFGVEQLDYIWRCCGMRSFRAMPDGPFVATQSRAEDGPSNLVKDADHSGPGIALARGRRRRSWWKIW